MNVTHLNRKAFEKTSLDATLFDWPECCRRLDSHFGGHQKMTGWQSGSKSFGTRSREWCGLSGKTGPPRKMLYN